MWEVRVYLAKVIRLLLARGVEVVVQGEECPVLLCSSKGLLSSSRAAEGRIKVLLPKLEESD